MIKFTGKGVCGGIAIGKLYLFERDEPKVKRIKITDTEAEKERYKRAKTIASGQLDGIYRKALKEVGETNAQIFEIHMMMLDDDDYNDAITGMIESQRINAEFAVAVTSDNFAEMFSSMEDSYMQARASDVRDVSNRLIKCLSENGMVSGMGDNEKMIICADDLAPSETVSLDKDRVLAFVTAYGSVNSHTAILARNMNIPAVIGVGEDFLNKIKNGDTCIADGFTGEVTVNPGEEILKEAVKKQRADLEQKQLLMNLKGKKMSPLTGGK